MYGRKELDIRRRAAIGALYEHIDGKR